MNKNNWQSLYQSAQKNDTRAIARLISLVENEADGYLDFLETAPTHSSKVIGITGPPGAGKSSIVNQLIKNFVNKNYRICVLCIDPSSPFNYGALLGDRLRMDEWYLHDQVFIRSIASRGALGGLSSKMIEITDVAKCGNFDYIIVETVGVGQSEVDIVGLADTTVVVLVPESGDEIQTMKAGLMEIADVFVINKCDRPDAERFYNNLKLKLAPTFNTHDNIDIIKTIATQNIGINELALCAEKHQQKNTSLYCYTLANKAFELIVKHRMKNVPKNKLLENIQSLHAQKDFNLYAFVKTFCL